MGVAAGAAGGGGMLASPWFQMLLGAMGQGNSGQNAGAGALAGLQGSAPYNRTLATTQILNNQTRDQEKFREWLERNPPGGAPSEQYAPNHPGILAAPQTPLPGMPPQASGGMGATPAIASMLAQQSSPPPPMVMPQPSPSARPPPMPQPQASAMPAAPPSAPPATGGTYVPTPQPAAAPPPQAAAPQSVGAWKGMPMAPPSMQDYGPMFHEAMKYPSSREWGLKGMLGLNKPGAESYRPLTPGEYKDFNIPPGTGAQIARGSGKVSGIGGGGVNVNVGQGKPPAGYEWGPDGTLIAIEGGPATKPSDAAVKQQVQSELGLRLLNEVDSLVAGGMETGTGAWAKANAAASPLLSWAVELSADEAKVASNLEMLSNIMLAAQRGAQVGPEEQKRYDKQLPRLGQEKSLFSANLAATKRNLKEMTTRMVEVRKQQGGRGTPPPPPGFIVK